jgi:hypothetical protein
MLVLEDEGIALDAAESAAKMATTIPRPSQRG